MKLTIGEEFDKVVDVMNNVFGRNYKACMRGCYALNKEAGTYAWFPKMAILSKSANPVEGDKNLGWLNIMSDDGQYIYMINYRDPGRMDMIEPSNDRLITFAKERGRKYTYCGVFERIKRDPEKGWIYKKVADDIEINEYL